MKIMIIEDDLALAHELELLCIKWNFEAKCIKDFKHVDKACYQYQPDLILLDINLPFYDGFYWCQKIRNSSAVPILFISSREQNADKIMALSAGGDDYIEKPFDLLELMSRVAVQARRISKNNILDFKGLELNIQKRACLVDGEAVELSGKEFEILNLLFKAKGNIVTREEIFACIWSTDAIIESRTLDMHIKSLRKKLKDKGNLIKTVYGVGYRLEL